VEYFVVVGVEQDWDHLALQGAGLVVLVLQLLRRLQVALYQQMEILQYEHLYDRHQGR
jgi:hypothetical protein